MAAHAIRLDTSVVVAFADVDGAGTAPLGTLLRRPTVVSISLFVDTHACLPHFDSLADATPAIHREGFGVLAMRSAPASALEAYASDHDLPFAVVADPGLRWLCGPSPTPDDRPAGATARTAPRHTAIVVDREGYVLAVLAPDSIGPGRQALRAVRSLATPASGPRSAAEDGDG